LEAQILRYHHVEKWRCGTIASQLGIHHETVLRVIIQAGLRPHNPRSRPSKIDAYVPFIKETLDKFPKLAASRLFEMAQERGYKGGPNHFRHRIALLRPRPAAEAFLRLSVLPGEQAQCDWGSFGRMQIGRASRPLMAFVMVLSYSRSVFLRFSLNAQMENFLRGHIGAFEMWGGRVPKTILYDNLKSAVLERVGDAIRFNPKLLAFASHHRFDPRPVAVARGNEKGRVERAIRYIRESFFAAREFADLDDLNAQADAWCRKEGADRKCPGDRMVTVDDAFAREQPLLLPMPETPYPLDEHVVVKVGKTPYVRFDLNDYSVPHTHVRRALEVRADLSQVRVFDGAVMIASHRRTYDRDQQIENPEHIKALVDQKRSASKHRGMNGLTRSVPVCQTLLEQAAVLGSNIGAITSALLKLHDLYGPEELGLAVEEALRSGAPNSRVVRRLLEKRRIERGAPPPVEPHLSERARAKDLPVRMHRLDSYDQLSLPGIEGTEDE